MACMNEVQQGQISSMAELTQLSLEELVNIDRCLQCHSCRLRLVPL